MIHLVPHVLQGLGQVPPVGAGTPPPGSDKLIEILRWTAWVVLGICVMGAFAVGARMAIAHHEGRRGEHMQGLAMVLAGCVLVGAASGLVNALV